jgi:hypothetical protein
VVLDPASAALAALRRENHALKAALLQAAGLRPRPASDGDDEGMAGGGGEAAAEVAAGLMSRLAALEVAAAAATARAEGAARDLERATGDAARAVEAQLAAEAARDAALVALAAATAAAAAAAAASAGAAAAAAGNGGEEAAQPAAAAAGGVHAGDLQGAMVLLAERNRCIADLTRRLARAEEEAAAGGGGAATAAAHAAAGVVSTAEVSRQHECQVEFEEITHALEAKEVRRRAYVSDCGDLEKY